MWPIAGVALSAGLVGTLLVTLSLGAEAAPRLRQAPSNPCQGLLAQGDRLPGVLASVPKYRSTYVLALPEQLRERVPSADAPALRELEVGVHANTPAADVARDLGLTRIRPYQLDRSALAQPLVDVAAGRLDAAILWGPLAGLGALDFDLEGKFFLLAVDKPRAAPPAFEAAVPESTPSQPCAAAIAEALEINGVLPAELLVSVDVRTLLGRKAPPVAIDAAQRGAPLYAQQCGQCHGPEAVAAPGSLAPVDLLRSVRRFQFPGFLYITLNGRPQKSMPPLRGTLTEDQITLIYQYVRARSQGVLSAGAGR